MKIAFDIDGVVAKSETAICDELLERTGHDLRNLWTSFDFSVPGYTWPETYDIIQDGILKRTDEIEPHEGAVNAIHTLYEYYEKKRPITFVTARPEMLEQVTHEWIKEHIGDIWYEVVFTEDKGKYLKDNKFNIIIEDRLKTANDLSKDLTVIYLINRPWNEGREHAWNIIRVDSVGEAVIKYIGGMETDYHDNEKP